MQTRRAAPPGAENLKPLDRCRRRKGGAGVNLRVRERSRARIRALSLKGLVTDAAGTAVENTDYLPFGEEILVSSGDTRFGIAAYGSSGLLRHKFTGKERDSESGMDYFLARYYSGPMGRFTSPDAPLSDQFAAPPRAGICMRMSATIPLAMLIPQAVHARQSSGIRVAASVSEQLDTESLMRILACVRKLDSLRRHPQSRKLLLMLMVQAR